jgi:hypothetical protein
MEFDSATTVSVAGETRVNAGDSSTEVDVLEKCVVTIARKSHIITGIRV